MRFNRFSGKYTLIFTTTLILGVFMVPENVFGQKKSEFFIENFEPDAYHAHGQNWAIAQLPSGIMCFANSSGLLSFDGSSWQLMEMPNKSVVRALAVDSEGKLFVGAQNDFGYCEDDSTGSTIFISLLNRLPKADQKFGDVWNIHITNGNRIFFETVDKIFVYKDDQFTIFRSKEGFHSCFTVENQFYTREWGTGLLKYDKDSLIRIPGSDFFSETIISGMFALSKHKTVIITKTEGFYTFDPNSESGTFEHWASNADEYLAKNQVYNCNSLTNNKIGLCTLTGGVFILDKNAQTETIINKNDGLCSDEVYAVFSDSQGQLWVGTGNGISLIHIDNSIKKYDKSIGVEGSFYCTTRFKGILYIGTSQGIFQEDEKGNFQKIENSDGQCWSFFETGGELLACHTNGVFQINNHKAFYVSDQTAWTIISLDKEQKHLLGGTDEYNPFTADYIAGFWKSTRRVRNFSESMRFLQKDDFGYIWAAAPGKGIFRFKLNQELDSAVGVVQFGEKDGLPSDLNNRVFKQNDGSLIFSTQNGLFRFDYNTNRFYPDGLNEKFHLSDATIYYHLEDKKGNIYLWLTHPVENEHIQTVIYLKKQGTDFLKIEKPFYKFKISTSAHSVDFDNSIFVDADGTARFSTSTAMYYFNPAQYSLKQSKFHTFFRKISTDSLNILNESLYPEKIEKRPKLILPYNDNSIYFEFSSDFFENSDKNQFAYKLTGPESDSSSWSFSGNARFTNLREGHYILTVACRNIYYEKSEKAVFEFDILPPWYRTKLAYLGLSILFVLFLYLLVRLYSFKLKKENLNLEKLIENRTIEIVEKNTALEVQKNEIEHQSHQLQKANVKISNQKEEVENAFKNVKMLSVIGQEITSHLSIQTIIETVYENINHLMDASIFSIGICNESKNILEFEGTKERGLGIAFYTENLENENSLSTICFKNNKEILIQNFSLEYTRYFSQMPIARVGEATESIIYIPLTVKSEKLGVLTVQSFTPNAYTDFHLDIVRNIGIYTWIALKNADSYRKIENQKLVIENQHEDITSGIRYAKKIQEAILPDRKIISQFLDNFIIYRPKEIVSGDFYWFDYFPEHNKMFIAVFDCTGHGVPGAFMSLIGSRLLNKVVNGHRIFAPDEILTELDKEIKIALKQDTSDNSDGMDACLVLIEKTENGQHITYSGAKRSLFCFKNGIMQTLPAARKPIGGNLGRMNHEVFKNHEIDLFPGDTVYLTSDGYTDQSNPDRKRFGTDKLFSILREIHSAPLSIQEDRLLRELDNYSGGFPQRDDITIIGLKF